ncbi:MAG: ATP-dependent helicase [Treponema sp.]|jgi:DNA helicase-2/ATP-dependent DNA helicase PcrA|nr:ATP-dependent helicase [Treponema sp.]
MTGAENLPAYLEMLNTAQRQAVLHTGRPLLILAGAGSGKTRVITTKIAWLIRERGIAPQSILAVTFTNKAAREMAARAQLIEERAAGAMLRTFHSFGAWFLRRNGAFAGLDSNFVIYDDDDMVSLLSTIMRESPKPEIKRTAHNISRAKDYFLSPGDPLLAMIDSGKKFRALYALYEERLAHTGNVDFGDLIKKPVEILRSEPQVARRFRERFSVILVDEYQDANVAQFELLRELIGPDTYVCVVGDDDQSIYRFRGAEVKNILEFPDRFSGTDIIRLESNYRSTAPILQAASSVVDHNQGRLGKTLRAERGGGKQPVLAFLPDQDEEVNFCASLIENSVTINKNPQKKNPQSMQPAQWADWAVLYRTNAQSLGFETEFLRRGIPYRVVGSLKFYEREEIKDALALLSFLVNPRDEVAFRRVVNKPARGLGAVTVDRLIEDSMAQGSDFLEMAKTIQGLTPKARKGLEAFVKVITDGKALLEKPLAVTNDKPQDGASGASGTDGAKAPKKKKRNHARDGESLAAGEGLSACVAQMIQNSGIAGYHIEHDEIMSNQRLTNMQELVNAASLYAGTAEGLLEFLEHIELDRSRENSPSGVQTGALGANAQVTLITFHNTKGLEFRRVIMTGLEQGIFPREDKKDEEFEEERRLFYVGATRAMDELYLTSCAMRRMYGRTMPLEPSQFVREIDKSCLRIIGRVPRGFSAHPWERDISGNTASELERRSGWRRGQRLFHDDYGYGSVLDLKDSGDGPVVRVQFETGKELRFLSEHQSSAFVKIGDDD